jgi:hypothetical protein
MRASLRPRVNFRASRVAYAAVALMWLSGCGNGGNGSAVDERDPESHTEATDAGESVSVFERPYSRSVDALDRPFQPLGRSVEPSDVRLARTVDGREYFVAQARSKLGRELCLLQGQPGGPDSGSTCDLQARLRDSVIYLVFRGDPSGMDMDVSGIAGDGVREVSVGSQTDVPEHNVFVLRDVPVTENLVVRFVDGHERSIDVVS